MRLLFFLLVFMLFGAFFVISEEGLRLNVEEDRGVFSGLYLNWLDNVFANGASITTNAIRENWLPGNGSNSSE